MTTTTPRERVWQAVRHVEPDRVPWSFGYTVPTRRKLEQYYGTCDLDEALGNHLAKYYLRSPDAWQEVRPGFWRDEFGVVWNRTVDKDIGVVEDYLLKERSLNGFEFPDPHDPARYEGLPAFIEKHRDRFRMANITFSLFERAWSLRGMSELMVDMIEAPEFVDELLDAITQHNLVLIEHAVRYDVDAVRMGDDWGQQTGLLFGGPHWRRFIKPRLAQMYGAVKAAGKAVFIHCCGKVQELFPDLIELGLDVFNPFQPEVMDQVEIKRQFGDQLAFHGGMSIQKTLPFSTPQDVRDEARRLMDTIGRGGGFIIGPSHDMPGDIPLENLVAFIETVREG
jgi:uroporphyrinogen decarboxylase